MLDVKRNETKLRTLSKVLHFLGTICGNHAVFPSDDVDVPEYLVQRDDEPELEMICVAGESKMYCRLAFGQLDPRK